MRKIGRVLKVLSLNLMIFIGLVILVHIIHKEFIYEPTKVLDGVRSNFEYYPYPYVTFKGEANKGPYNENGYRGRVPLVKKEENSFRVFLLGGSSLVNGTKTLAELLQEKFDEEGMPVEIYNMGVVSSAIGQDLSRIIHEVVDHEPDLVVFYHGYNELMNQVYGDPRVGYPFNFWVTEINLLSSRSADDFPLWKLLLLKSSIARDYFTSELEEIVIETNRYNIEAKKFSESWEKEIVNHYWDSFEKVERLGKAFGFETLAFFQPVVFGHSNYQNQDHSNEHTRSLFSRMFRLLKEDQRRKRFNYFDLSSFFDNHSLSPFRDDVHIDDKGRDEITSHIFPIIKTLSSRSEFQ